jgi:hypothetical protein
LLGDLGPGAFEQMAIRHHPRTHRLACATPETEAENLVELGVDVGMAVGHRNHRLKTAPG